MPPGPGEECPELEALGRGPAVCVLSRLPGMLEKHRAGAQLACNTAAFPANLRLPPRQPGKSQLRGWLGGSHS